MGSSDPALWAKEVLAAIKIGQTDTVKAAEKALKQKNFASAMYSARYTVALGDSLCGEELTDRILATPEIAAILPQLRREPWRRSEWIPAIEKSTNTNTSAATEATPERTHESAGLKSGAVFYDGRFYSNEILDAAGGSGFAEFVRGNPRIEVPIRASAFFQGLKIFFALFLVVAGIGGYVSESQSGKPMNELMKAFFGLAAMCAFLGWSFWEARKNRIILANGTIFVGRKSGHATFIDAIKRVRRRRFVFVKKVVSVEHVGGEVMWPVQGPAKSLVESVIEIAIKLRSEWVSDVNGAARVDAMKVD